MWHVHQVAQETHSRVWTGSGRTQSSKSREEGTAVHSTQAECGECSGLQSVRQGAGGGEGREPGPAPSTCSGWASRGRRLLLTQVGVHALCTNPMASVARPVTHPPWQTPSRRRTWRLPPPTAVTRGRFRDSAGCRLVLGAQVEGRAWKRTSSPTDASLKSQV